MATMRAALQDRYGPPDVLGEAVVERPAATPEQVLVRVQAASVNGYDVLVRSGALKMVTGRSFPKRTGLDFVGEVAEPDRAGAFARGDRVWGVLPLHELGGVAEYVAVAPGHLAAAPPTLSIPQAAALPVVGATALAALRDVAALRPGERLLVRGAGGGVGAVAVQIGKATGAHVTGLAGAGDLDFVRGLGAEAAIDYAGVQPAGLGPFDVILDGVGRDTEAYRRRLAPGGRLVAIVPNPAHPVRWMVYAQVSAVFGGRRVRFFSAKPDTAILSELTRRVEAGTIRPTLGGTFPLARIADAHRAFEAGRRGKQVVVLDDAAIA